MSFRRTTQQQLEKRLVNESDWAKSPIGKLTQLLVDKETSVSFNNIATLLGRDERVVIRWFLKVNIPAGTAAGHTDASIKLGFQLDNIRIAIEQSMKDGELPTIDTVRSLKPYFDELEKS